MFESEDSEMQELMMSTVIDTILPKVKPFIPKATERATKYLQEGRMMLIKVVNGRVHAFVIREENIESFEMKEGTEPEMVYDMDEFIEKILKGDFDFSK